MKKNNKTYKNKNKKGGTKTNSKKNNKSLKSINKKEDEEDFKQVKCSPSSVLDKKKSPTTKNDFTCYNDETLLKIRELWNSRHPDAKIDST